MANLLTELDVSRSTDIDANSKAAAVRVFDTVLIDSAAVEQAFDNEVGRGPYPSNPALRFDRLSIVPNIRGSGHRVTAYYSTFGGGRFQTRQEPEGYSFRWRYGNTLVTVEIPANVREKRLVTSGDERNEIEVWVAVPVPVDEYRTTWTFQAYTEINNPRQLENITEQMGVVHTIYGRKVRLASGNARNDEKRPGWYNVEYTWEVDKGTRKFGEANPFGERFLILDPDNRPANAEFYRLPYESFVSIPSTDPENEPHSHISVSTFADNANGWQNLPGTQGIQ